MSNTLSCYKNQLTAYDGQPITYDAIGNPTVWYDGAVMSWVNGRRLASIGATAEHAALSFTYDSDGLRLTKTVGTGNDALLVQNTSNNTTTETWYYYVTNLQGDVVALLDTTGNTVAEYSYNAWGEMLAATGTMAGTNPIRYRGYYYDSDTVFLDTLDDLFGGKEKFIYGFVLGN